MFGNRNMGAPIDMMRQRRARGFGQQLMAAAAGQKIIEIGHRLRANGKRHIIFNIPEPPAECGAGAQAAVAAPEPGALIAGHLVPAADGFADCHTATEQIGQQGPDRRR